jgi:hypothetical protein
VVGGGVAGRGGSYEEYRVRWIDELKDDYLRETSDQTELLLRLPNQTMTWRFSSVRLVFQQWYSSIADV